jgi:hypothetical protein
MFLEVIGWDVVDFVVNLANYKGQWWAPFKAVVHF